MSKIECLQQITGSCISCDKPEMIINKVNQEGMSVDSAIDQVGKRCPNPSKPQAHLIKPKSPVGMGQNSNAVEIIR